MTSVAELPLPHFLPTAAASGPNQQLATVSRVITERRSNLRVDPDRPVPPDLVTGLLRLAQQAPNHRRLWPLRAAVLTGNARQRFGQALAAALPQGTNPAKVAKLQTKYRRAPMLVVLGTDGHPDRSVTDENRLTGGAAAQNFLLGAHAAGLAGFWASPPEGTQGAVQRFLGWPDDTDIVGLFYLGWPLDTVAPVLRPEVPTVWLDQ